MAWRRSSKQKGGVIRRLFDFLLTGFIFLAVALLAAHLTDASKEQVRGPFFVLDGDSLRTKTAKLRLEGIDAPEWEQQCLRKKGDAVQNWHCGRQSKNHLKSLVSKGSIKCLSFGNDKYDRPLVKCTVGDVDLNAKMVADGWAVSYGDYYAEEAAAKRSKLGIWQGSFERPQDWRRARKGELVDAGIGVGQLVQFKRWLISWF